MLRRILAGVSLGVLLAAFFASQSPRAQVPPAQAGLVVGRNVNMVSGTGLPGGDPFLQRQNEPSVAASTRNPLHLVGGANDYRTVDMPGLHDDIETGDAWLGVFKSLDGGQRWRSTLLPGYPQDDSCDPSVNPGADPARCALFGYQAGADPVVRAGTNGLVYYGGLVFDRTDPGGSAIFVARFIDNNNKENGDPIAYLGASIVASADGATDRFLDKPWIAVDVPRGPAPSCTIVVPEEDGQDSVDPQTIPAGNVYVAYTAITGPTAAPDRAEIYFSQSSDCGETWSPPVRLSRDEDQFNQGASIAVDPRNGHVYVAWRRIGAPDDEEGDAFMVTRSTTLGRRFSNPGAARRFPRGRALGLDPARYFEHRKTKDPVVVADEAEFDQPTSAFDLMFRTNAYPTMTVDDEGRVYLAWSERGFAVMRPDAVNGDARVVVATSPSGQSWTPPRVVEDMAEPGHQIMPTVGFSGGRLMVAYYDLREDRSQVFAPAVDDRTAIGMPQPDGSRRRHTIDLRAAMGVPGEVPVFDASVRVSEYRLGTLPNEVGPARQLQWNPPNLPLFRLGTVPFIGDYIDLTPAPAFLQGPDGTWAYNTAATAAPIFHAVWTDNRDVRAPLDGDWATYTPPTGPFTAQSCVDGHAGMRNQNIYTARLTRGLLAGSPGNTKPLTADFPRGFVVFAQNTTDQVRTFRLSILDQPPGGWASFRQEPVPLLVSVDATVPPRSVVSRTVYVTSTDPHARVSIDVAEIPAPGAPAPVPDGLRSQVILNPDISNPDISNPDISNPDISNPDISNAEVYNPDISNPDISNPDISNPDISNPDISNPDISNVRLANPDISNPDISNPDISNPDISNPDISNPDISNPDISNGALTDVTWTVTNTGNTAATFDVDLFLSQATVPEGIKVQLVLHRVYKTPVTDGCDLKTEAHNVLVANIVDPTFRIGQPGAVMPDPANPDISNATLWIEPDGQAKITLRILDTDPTDANTLDPLTDVTPVVTSEALNTADIGTPAEQPADWPGATPSSSTLTFVTQPSATNLGLPIVPAVQVEARDSEGSLLAGAAVTLALAANPAGGHVVGTATTATNGAGIATFAGLWVDREGLGYQLIASAGSVDADPALSGPFAVLPGCVAATPLESHVEGPDIDSHPFALREAMNIDGDAVRDMVVLHENGLVTLMAGTGTGAFSIRFQTTILGKTSPRSLAVADLNGDQNSDVVVGYSTSDYDNVGVMLGDGAGFVIGMPALLPAGGAVHDIVVGQFNPTADTYPDLALTFEDSADVKVLFGDGAGNFGLPQTVGTMGASSGALAVGRMNADGFDDLIAATPGAAGAVSVLIAGGDGSFTPATAAIVGLDLASVAAADLDGDGRADVVVADPTSGAVHVLLGDGIGGLSPSASVPVAGEPQSIVTGYFDGNAAIDLATANPGGNTFAILFNDGTGAFGAPVPFTAEDEPTGITAGDFNGDGAMDLAVANRLRTGPYETISVLVNTCLPGATSVTSTSDGGPGSLRDAILRANANVGFPDMVAFAIAGPGPHTITPASPLPQITDPVVVDGTTEPGFDPIARLPVVELSGVGAGAGADGLVVTAGNSVIRGLAINGFAGSAIELRDVGGNRVVGNHLGVDRTGTVVYPNGVAGVFVNSSANTIGGATDAERNIMSGNHYGVVVDAGTGNRILGNFIGSDVTGTVALGNDSMGVSLRFHSNQTSLGGSLPGEGNLIVASQHTAGVSVQFSNDNVIQGNLIGTNTESAAGLGNLGSGIDLFISENNLIGGSSPSERNVISGNGGSGISLSGSRTNTIAGNYIGLSFDGSAGLGNGSGGIRLQAYEIPPGGSMPPYPYPGDHNEIRGNVIAANAGAGISLSSVHGGVPDTLIARNRIGVNVHGVARGNTWAGVSVDGSPRTAIGGPGAGNFIGGNGDDGVRLMGAATTDTQIEDNFIGLRPDLETPVPNTGDGIAIAGAVNSGVVDNTIAYNTGDGISVTGATATGNRLSPNRVFSNGALGIDLGADGVTINDAGGGDADSGPNGLLNFPVLTAAINDGTQLLVDGSVDIGLSYEPLVVEFFASPACDASGYGEGAQHLGSAPLTTEVTGVQTFTGLSLPIVPAGWSITATTTSPLTSGATSEFSACLTVFSPVSFIALPSTWPAGASFPVTVLVTDTTGAVIPGVWVTLGIGSGPPGAVLSGGTTMMTDAEGRAGFVISLSPAGSYTLVASVGSVSGTSATFTITP